MPRLIGLAHGQVMTSWFFVCKCRQSFARSKSPQWRCSDYKQCDHFIKQNYPEVCDGASLLLFLQNVQDRFECKKSNKDRRCEREPQQIKQWRLKLREPNIAPAVAESLRDDIFKAKRAFLLNLRLLRERQKLGLGKPLESRKRLFQIHGLRHDDQTVTVEPAEISKFLFDIHRQKWECNHCHRLELLEDIVSAHEGYVYDFDTSVWDAAVASPKRPSLRDHLGVAPLAVKLVYYADRARGVELFNRLAGTRICFADFSISCKSLARDLLLLRLRSIGPSCLSRLFCEFSIIVLQSL